MFEYSLIFCKKNLIIPSFFCKIKKIIPSFFVIQLYFHGYVDILIMAGGGKYEGKYGLSEKKNGRFFEGVEGES